MIPQYPVSIMNYLLTAVKLRKAQNSGYMSRPSDRSGKFKRMNIELIGTFQSQRIMKHGLENLAELLSFVS